jgi:hypothetical protein
MNGNLVNVIIYDDSPWAIGNIKTSLMYADKTIVILPEVNGIPLYSPKLKGELLEQNCDLLCAEPFNIDDIVGCELVDYGIGFSSIVMDVFTNFHFPNPSTINDELNAYWDWLRCHREDSSAGIDYEKLFDYLSNLNDGEMLIPVQEYLWLSWLLLSVSSNVMLSLAAFHLGDHVLNGNIATDFYIRKFVESRANTLPFQKAPVHMLIPDVTSLTIDDIFELRYAMPEEIMKLQSCIRGLYDMAQQGKTYQAIELTVKHAIEECEMKLRSTKRKTVQKIIRDIKNPLSYSPLIATFLGDVPPLVSLAGSAAFIGIDSILEHKNFREETTTHPMYFTFNINAEIQNLIRLRNKTVV